MRIDVNVTHDLPELSAKVTDAVEYAVKLTADDAKKNLWINSPIDTGRLSLSWRQNRISQLRYMVYTKVKYAKWVNDGTGIYGPTGRPITPKRAKYLRFEINGQVIYAKSVRGQKGQKYVEKSVTQTEQRKSSFVSQALSRAGLI
ncbi:HK97 gp10 family phage protein [Risungbinella massiliensis]|uniref:HK97 gp10 family phage protein n=1 Tax=Risungbinella massiliensis TaxID=1329796 RepID=UPI0005CC0939|nr:HK97 gp10 family phage protein [Risungbinella massiliensis]